MGPRPTRSAELGRAPEKLKPTQYSTNYEQYEELSTPNISVENILSVKAAQFHAPDAPMALVPREENGELGVPTNPFPTIRFQ